MRSSTKLASITFSFLLFGGCSFLFGSEKDDLSRPALNSAGAVLANVSEHGLSADCPAGGVDIEVGIDSNGDQVLSTDEISRVVTLCHGVAGTRALVLTQSIEPGADCPTGGLRVQSGLDENGDNVLQEAEVVRSDNVCHGSAGSNGLSARFVISVLEAGDPCPAGGIALKSGMDVNGDGELNDIEVQQEATLCHGIPGADGSSCTVNRDEETQSTTLSCEDGTTASVFDGAIGERGPRGETGANGNDGTDGQDGADGFAQLSKTDAEVGDFCDEPGQGGQRIHSGLDNGDGDGIARNGILEDGEVDNTTVICHGATGAQGPQGDAGAAGEDGSSCTVSRSENGHTIIRCEDGSDATVSDGVDGVSALIEIDDEVGNECASSSNGGRRIRSGLDDGAQDGIAGNGILEDGEVDATTFICHGESGAAGENGENGFNALTVTDNDVGDACTANGNGGVRIRNGIDNGDGGGVANNSILEEGEIDDTNYVCHGAMGPTGQVGDDGFASLVRMDDNVGSACALNDNGGQRVHSGLDNGEGGGIAGNGLLEDGEIDQTTYVCNGANGATGQSGHDGTHGFSTLTATDDLVGNACDAFGNGGMRIRNGLDNGEGGGIARNGVLENGEVDSTAYVCHGATGRDGTDCSVEEVDESTQAISCSDGTRVLVQDGATGESGFSTLSVTDASVGAACDGYGNGGQRIRSGLDNGDGGGDARNGILESGEVDSTTYVCNGANGTNGVDGQNGADGQDGQNGADGQDGQDGRDGFSSLIRLDAELGGPNCPFSGTRVLSGIDDNADGILQDEEIDDESVVCSSTPGDCAEAYHAEAEGICVFNQRDCEVTNGKGLETWSDTVWGDCTPTECDADFHIEELLCNPNQRACAIENGLGEQTWVNDMWGMCTVVDCDAGFHNEANLCVSDTRTCEIANGYGIQTWNNGSWGGCIAETCAEGFVIEGEACVEDPGCWVEVRIYDEDTEIHRKRIEATPGFLPQVMYPQIGVGAVQSWRSADARIDNYQITDGSGTILHSSDFSSTQGWYVGRGCYGSAGVQSGYMYGYSDWNNFANPNGFSMPSHIRVDADVWWGSTMTSGIGLGLYETQPTTGCNRTCSITCPSTKISVGISRNTQTASFNVFGETDSASISFAPSLGAWRHVAWEIDFGAACMQ